jgi:polar amino acid transport system substrate-binding protein
MIDAALRAELVPTGRLRVSLNMANPVLAQSHTAPDRPAGVTIDLSRELARRLNVELDFLQWESPGDSVLALARGVADVGYLAVDPKRAEQVQFTTPYVQIEACYMVGTNSHLQGQLEVDRPGIEILVIETSAYDLYLTRNLQHASIVRLPTSEDVLQKLLRDTTGQSVAAGIKQALLAQSQRVGGLRLLDGHFLAIRQAMVLPRATGAQARAAVEAFLDDMVSSGFISESLSRHRIAGVTVIGTRGHNSLSAP